MKQVRPEREDEIRAREIVCAALGATAEVLDCGPLQGVADYRLGGLRAKREGDSDCSGDVGVLEVTTHGDPLRINLGKQMDRGGWEHPAARLNHFWSITLPPISRHETHLPYRFVDVIDRIGELEELLLELEAHEVLDFGPTHAGPVADRLRDLGAYAAHGLSTGEPGMYFLPPGQGGGSGPRVVTAAVEAEAAKSDNCRKLQRGPYPGGEAEVDRPFPAHLFVWIAPDRMLAFQSLADEESPAQMGPITPEVTDVWVAGQFRSGEIVWHWSDGAWARVATDRPFCPR